MIRSKVVDAAAPVIVHTGAGNLGARVVELPII
jgi:hypothetical protein